MRVDLATEPLRRQQDLDNVVRLGKAVAAIPQVRLRGLTAYLRSDAPKQLVPTPPQQLEILRDYINAYRVAALPVDTVSIVARPQAMTVPIVKAVTMIGLDVPNPAADTMHQVHREIRIESFLQWIEPLLACGLENRIEPDGPVADSHAIYTQLEFKFGSQYSWTGVVFVGTGRGSRPTEWTVSYKRMSEPSWRVDSGALARFLDGFLARFLAEADSMPATAAPGDSR